LTEQSADRLALTPGKEVLVLIKAPWVNLRTEATHADNSLPGTIQSIQQGKDNSEVLVQLAGGDILCATVPNADVIQLSLTEGQNVFAEFEDDKAIIATLC